MTEPTSAPDDVAACAGCVGCGGPDCIQRTVTVPVGVGGGHVVRGTFWHSGSAVGCTLPGCRTGDGEATDGRVSGDQTSMRPGSRETGPEAAHGAATGRDGGTDAPALVRVEIDPNIRAPLGGGTRAGLDDADGPLTPGQDVIVYESESGLTGPGRVTRIDHTNQLVYLAVDWAALREEPAPAPSPDPALLDRAAEAARTVLDGTGPRTTDEWATLVARAVLAALAPELARAERAEREVDRLTKLLSQYADRGIENGQRAERAEKKLTRARDAITAAREHSTIWGPLDHRCGVDHLAAIETALNDPAEESTP